jgi:gliding motility-associated-like protein
MNPFAVQIITKNCFSTHSKGKACDFGSRFDFITKDLFFMRNNYSKLILVFISLTVIFIPGYAQNGMSGKEFVIGNLSWPHRHFLINVYAKELTKGKIFFGNNYENYFTVEAGEMITLDLSNMEQDAYAYHSEEIENKGFVIQTDKDVVVYAGPHQDKYGDASLILPLHVLQSEYMALSFSNRIHVHENFYWRNPSEFVLVGAVDNTVIEIIPSAESSMGKPAGIPFTINLNKGQTYLYKAAHDFDISGSVIKGLDKCKPFAVFCGNRTIKITEEDFYDILYEQLLPTGLWGQNYFAVPPAGGSTFKIIASENRTTVTLNGSNIILNSGQSHTVNRTFSTIYITSDKPILVAQITHGFSMEELGDPSLLYLMPWEQKSKLIEFTTFDLKYDEHTSFSHLIEHFTIVVSKSKDVNTILLNGSSVSAFFTDYPSAPGYSYAIIKVDHGAHVITAPAGVIASVYGYGFHSSYIYAAAGSEKLILKADPTVCAGTTTTFSAIGSGVAGGYWDFGNNDYGFGKSTEYSFKFPGRYTVTFSAGIAGNNCLKIYENMSESIEIEVLPTPELTVSNDTTILLGTTAILNAQGEKNIVWSPSIGLSCTDCTSPIAGPQKTTTYIAKATGENGCIIMDSLTVYVDEDLHIFMPNIFSPNGDGQNDIFYVRGKGVKDVRLIIFNRWGEKVFESNDINRGWDGNFRGEAVSPGVFVYFLEATLESGQKIRQQGDVAVVR